MTPLRRWARKRLLGAAVVLSAWAMRLATPPDHAYFNPEDQP